MIERRGKVQPHVGIGGRVDAQGREELEHAIDGVLAGARRVRHAAGIGEEGEFARIGVAHSERRAGDSGQDAGAGEALAVQNDVVRSGSKGAEQGAEFGATRGHVDLADARADEGDDAGEGGMAGDGGGEGVLHEPVDARGGERAAERGQDRDRSADIAQGAGADDEDARGGV